MSGQKIDDLPGRLREVAQMDHATCAEAFAALPGIAVPSRLRTATLRRLLAHEVQVRALGELSPKEQRVLKTIAGGRRVPETNAAIASPGTHLVREWNGRTYRVEVTDAGYVLDGTAFRSLSVVAKRITGTAWSGPRFFGLSGRWST